MFNTRLWQLVHICVVVQFYPWFKFHFPLFQLGMVMYDNELKTKKNKI